MSTTTIANFPRPVEGDCAPYYFRYIDKVPEGDIVSHLVSQQKSFGDFILKLTPDQLHYRYAPDKWSIAEMIGHILDAERVFAYRMMCISRGEQKSLPGYEQDDYVVGSAYHDVPGDALAAEWDAVRLASIWLCRNMTEDMASRVGLANDTEVKASAYPYILVGHIIDHLRTAKERYNIE